MVASMIIGHARASTSEQDTAAQMTALTAAGCELTFQKEASGGRSDQPKINKLLDQRCKGEVLTSIEPVQERKAALRSLMEAVDMTTRAPPQADADGRTAFAEYERAMLSERIKAGGDPTREQGRIGGRLPRPKPQQQKELVRLVREGEKTAAKDAPLFGGHPATVARPLQRA
jgi:DNA invertase Pin-like site-specific DNA recombinase